MSDDNKDKILPPRPGEKQDKKEIKGVPFIIYINGKPIEMCRQEALSVMAQITNILIYLDNQELENNG
jgi:hypothetical protein